MRRATKRALRRTDDADGDVGVAAQQILISVGEREFEFDCGMFAPEISEDRRQDFDAHDLARSDPHDATLGRRFAGSRAGEGGRGGGHRLACGMRPKASCVGISPCGEREKSGELKRGFKRVDMPADGGLAQREAPRSAREVAVAHDLQKRAVKLPAGFARSHA